LGTTAPDREEKGGLGRKRGCKEEGENIVGDLRKGQQLLGKGNLSNKVFWKGKRGFPEFYNKGGLNARKKKRKKERLGKTGKATTPWGEQQRKNIRLGQ